MSKRDRPRLVVIGRTGQLARALLENGARDGKDVVSVGRPALDLCNPESVFPTLAAARPDVVVIAAAYTAVDRAEQEPDRAFAINEEGAAAAAQAAATLGVPVVHLSTDYVFHGVTLRPWLEVDSVAPQTTYGRSKLAGEIAVANATARHAILRTAWIYSPFGANFVRTMLSLAVTRSEIRVVEDQKGCPTSAADLARAAMLVAEYLARGGSEACGTFHAAGAGEATWADFAAEIFDVSARLGGPWAQVVRVSTTEYPTLAPRPADSRLDCSKLQRVFGIEFPCWRTSLQPVIARLLGVSA